MEEKELIYDWNTASDDCVVPTKPIEFDDETLRDGLQSPSVIDPTIEEKIEILHLMNELGIHMADIGLPGAGPRAQEHVTALAKEIADNRLDIAAATVDSGWARSCGSAASKPGWPRAASVPTAAARTGRETSSSARASSRTPSTPGSALSAATAARRTSASGWMSAFSRHTGSSWSAAPTR